MPGFSGQGIVSLAERLPNGKPGVFFDFGNADVYDVNLAEESVERRESRTGQRLTNRKMTKSQGGTIQLKGDEFNLTNFALAVKGMVSNIAAGSAVTGYVLPDELNVGDIVTLPAKNVSAVTIKDSTGSPKTLTLGTNYTLDALSGEVTIVNLTTGGPFTQPLKGDYTPGAVQVVGAFKGEEKEYYVRLKGINTDTGKRGIHDTYRVKFSPAKVLKLINDDFMDWELDGTVLVDLTRDASSPEGQYYSFTEAST